MVKFCSPGLKSRYFIYIVLGSISFIIRFVSFDLFNQAECNPLIRILFMSIGMCLCFILEVITQKRTHRTGKKWSTSIIESEINDLKISSINDPNKKVSKITIIDFLILFGITVLDTIGFAIVQYVQNKLAGKSTEDSIFYGQDLIYFVCLFFIVTIFSRLFLNLHLYKHHYVYITIILIGLIMVLLTNIVKKTELELAHFIVVIGSFLFGIVLVVQKYLLHYRYLSPFIIVAIMGSFNLIIGIIIGLINLGFNNEYLDIKQLSKLGTLSYFCYSLVFIVGSFGYNLFAILINFTLGPTNRISLDILSVLVIILIRWINNQRNLDPLPGTLYFSGHIVSFIGGILFNETIVLYIRNLNKNTKTEIRNRAESIDNSNASFQKKVQLKRVYTEKNNDDEDEDDDEDGETYESLLLIYFKVREIFQSSQIVVIKMYLHLLII